MPRVQINQKIAVSVVFVSAMFMNILDATIVNVALPQMARDFGTTSTAIDSVAIAYMVSLAVFIPASGWLGDKFGARRVMLVAIAVFTLASALCGMADTLGQLVAFRILQGVGGGMLAPVGMAMLFRTFPPHERVRASSILTIPTALAPALGPVLGGLLVTHYSWPWVFWVNIPLGVAAIAFGLIFLREAPRENAGRFDLPGFVLCGLGLATFMFGVSEGPKRGWSSPEILATLIGGLAVLIIAVTVESRTAQPMVAVRLMGNRLLRSASLVTICASMAFLGTLYAISLYFQDGRGMDPLEAGLSVFPEAIGVMLGAQVASRFVFPRLGPRLTVSLGLTGVMLSCALLATLGTGSSLWLARLYMVTLGFAMSHVFVTSQAVAFATISPAQTGQASTLFNTIRQIGGAAGVAFLTTSMITVGTTTSTGEPNVDAYRVAFGVAAAFALLALGFAQTIRNDEALQATRTPATPAPTSPDTHATA
ncbi:DHA2 family efflux MFS transporter permease subunit [Kineosporia babensis]|uniref:DHA2 family efflux MFS transporter permease subunit n=1 Tax=Kineosporia babensis TaxID=499548 RepID=A0A9X1NL94_9ACTN|nr:DHA2 family efflux MFS transporter permease subunit [Kineosporia babensis]MCD5315854.1 DHA2 family efflux MFS transporter permease subunit [Kineosporia babensis]